MSLGLNNHDKCMSFLMLHWVHRWVSGCFDSILSTKTTGRVHVYMWVLVCNHGNNSHQKLHRVLLTYSFQAMVCASTIVPVPSQCNNFPKQNTQMSYIEGKCLWLVLRPSSYFFSVSTWLLSVHSWLEWKYATRSYSWGFKSCSLVSGPRLLFPTHKALSSATGPSKHAPQN